MAAPNRLGRTSALVVVLLEVKLRLGFWEVDSRDLDVVVVVVRRVGSDEHAVHRVVLVGGPAFTRACSSASDALARPRARF